MARTPTPAARTNGSVPQTIAPAAPVKVAATQASEMFVTPRVVDQRAFEEFAAALTALIERASSQIEPLTSATVHAEKVALAMRTLEQRQAAHAERAESTLASLEQRLNQIETMLQRSTDCAAAVKAFEEHTDRIIAERVESFARAVDERLGAAVARASEIQQRAESAAQTIASRAERAQAAVESVADRHREALTGLVARGESLAGVGVNGSAMGGGGGSLAGLVERGEELLSRAAQTSAQLDSIRRQTESAKQMLGESLLAGAEEVDRVQKEHETLREGLKDSLEVCRAAQSVLKARSEELQALVQPALDGIAGRATALITSLQAASAQAEGASERVTDTLMSHRVVAAQLASLLQQLEPWRPLLVERPEPGPDGEPQLPAPVAEIVVTLRRELARQMSAFSSALAGLSQGVAKAGLVTDTGNTAE